MRRLVRGMIIAGLVSCAVILIAAGTAHSQSWNSSVETGLTSVISDYQDGEYTWILLNNSSLSSDKITAFDILVWDLMPYQIEAPSSWTAPDGWKWDGKKMTVESNSGKYFTPYAIGPGQSLEFSYRPDPGGKIINKSGPDGVKGLFSAHVGAVIPGSGTFDGSRRWDEYRFGCNGITWHDRPDTTFPQNPVAEPSGLLALSAGGLGLTSIITARIRRAIAVRSGSR